MTTLTNLFAAKPAGGQRRPGAGNALAVTLATVWVVVALAPFLFMIVASFRSQMGYFTENPWLPVGELSLENWTTVFESGMTRYFINSVVVTVTGGALTLLLSMAFAYSTVKNPTRLSNGMFKTIMVGLAIPVQAIIVPLFVVVNKIGLYDNLIGLVLILTAGALPLSVIVMTNFVREVPNELIQAMRLDGAGDWTILFRLIAPMSVGAIGILSVFNGLGMWNNFLVPLLFTQNADNGLLPLGLVKFQGEYGVNVPAVMASVVLATMPLIVLFLLTRKHAMQAFGGISTMK